MVAFPHNYFRFKKEVKPLKLARWRETCHLRPHPQGSHQFTILIISTYNVFKRWEGAKVIGVKRPVSWWSGGRWKGSEVEMNKWWAMHVLFQGSERDHAVQKQARRKHMAARTGLIMKWIGFGNKRVLKEKMLADEKSWRAEDVVLEKTVFRNRQTNRYAAMLRLDSTERIPDGDMGSQKKQEKLREIFHSKLYKKICTTSSVKSFSSPVLEMHRGWMWDPRK